MAAPVVLLLVKVSIVLAAALAAAWMARRTAARTRHRLWSSAFAAVLALPLLAVAMPGLPVPVPSWMATAEDAAQPLSTDVVRADREPRRAETIDVTAQAEDRGLDSSGLEARAAGVPRPSRSTILAALWGAGALAALVSLAIALWRVRRLSRTGCPLDDPEWARPAAALAARLGFRGRVRLLVSPQVSTPLAGGILAPTIYLPATAAQWSADQREVVLAHELSHLAGRDPLRQVLTRVALAAYWFHPLAWIAARQSAVAREQACDEAVLALGTRPSLYARVLLDFADAPGASMTGLAALPMVQRTHLEKRLMAILNENVRPSARRVALIPAAVAALTLSVAAAQPAEIAPLAAAVEQTASGVASGAAGGVSTGVNGGVTGGVVGGVAGGVTGGVFTGVSGGVMDGATGVVATGAAARQAGSVCYPDSLGSFSGSINMSDTDGSRTIHEAIGRRQADVVIVKSFGDLRVCAMAEALSRNEALRPSQWAGAARRVIFETREGRETRRMDIEGSRVSWSVNGESRAVDAAAGEWRNRLVALLDPLWQLSRLRGEVSSLRGQISSIHGERSSLRGQISSLRGQVSSMRGEISSWRGQESSLRGQISSIEGHLSSLRGLVSSERGAISSLAGSRWGASDAERARIAERIRAHEARIQTIQADIARYDADAKIREVEKALVQLAVHEKVADVEKRLRDFNLEQQVEAVEQQIAQLDVEKRVAEIEQRITALDADRRSRVLEEQIEAALTRLRELR